MALAVESLPFVPAGLQKLADRVRYIVSRDGRLMLTRLQHPFMVCRRYEPGVEEAVGFEPFTTIDTSHKFGWHVQFNPTFADVLSQIPKEHHGRVAGFQILEDPTATDEGIRQSHEHKCHRSRILLYEKK